MKNLRVLLVCLFMAGVMLQLSAFADDIGVIDMKKTWTKYSKAVEIDKQLNKKEVELERYLLDKKRKIANGKTPLERKNLEDKYAKQFKSKLLKIQDWYKQEQAKLDSTMVETIKQVAVKEKLKTVLVKKAVIYGGTDITDSVVKALNR